MLARYSYFPLGNSHSLTLQSVIEFSLLMQSCLCAHCGIKTAFWDLVCRYWSKVEGCLVTWTEASRPSLLLQFFWASSQNLHGGITHETHQGLTIYDFMNPMSSRELSFWSWKRDHYSFNHLWRSSGRIFWTYNFLKYEIPKYEGMELSVQGIGN